MTRKYTNQLLEMIDDGLLDRDTVITACLNALSEQDVQDMMEANEFIEEQFEDEDDGQPDEAQEWESFDPEC